jgi:phosphomannomutase
MLPGVPATSELILSVSGVRGIVGESLTTRVASDFAAVFAAHLRETRSGDPLICLGRDSRPTGEAIEAAVADALARRGCRVVRLGIEATPTVSAMVAELSADGGIVVTASHNPEGWNGLKCLDDGGAALAPEVAAAVIERFRGGGGGEEGGGSAGSVETRDDAAERHLERIVSVVDPEPSRAAGFRVVLDSVNGAGGPAGRRLLEAYGCDVVALHAEPHGAFAHPPEPLRENLTELAERTAAEAAVVGFAQDPDADRLAIVDERGEYIGEEYTLALCARSWIGRGNPPRVAANLSTSRLVDHVAPGGVIRTPVGEANVVAGMRRHDATLGGEGNGGVIVPQVCWTRDSLSSMALIVDLLAREGRPLSEIVADLPRYEMVKQKIDLADLGGRDAIAGLLARVASQFASERVDTSDGVRVDFADGWVHVRGSNTEPIARVIGEAGSVERAEELVGLVREVVEAG